MSRLIVKNLAQGITQDKLTEVFSQKGVVTDVQLKFTASGKFRHFAFVGFKKEDDAQQALQYFNNTFINGSRIKVEFCSNLGSRQPLSRNKYSSESADIKEFHGHSNDKVKSRVKESSVINALKSYEDDPVFAEFVATHAKSDQIWGDFNASDDLKNCRMDNSSTISNPTDPRSDDVENFVELNNIAKSTLSDSEYMKMKIKGNDVKEEILPSNLNNLGKLKVKKSQILHHIKIKGMKFNAKKRDIKEFLNPLKPLSIRRPVKMKGIAYVGFATEREVNIALKKHNSFYAGRRIFVHKYRGVSKFSEESETVSTKWKEQMKSIKHEETIAESGRIFARNLAYTVTENDIESLFSKFGKLVEVNMPIDRVSRKPKGFAIVIFMMPEHALEAFTQLDGSVFHGRMLHLIPGKSKKSVEELLEMDNLTFQQKRSLEKKAQASISANWNSLFIGQNTVADLVAKNYDTTKENLLDTRGSGSLAVRLALGETEIVNATRQFLLDNSIHLDAFNQPTTSRSKTVLLVKNLPAETSSAEISQLFAKFGELGRVVLPPSGVTAIVEFLEPSEARHAFKKLAYSKFKHVPLYLEWAPSNIFVTQFTKKKDEKPLDANKLKENELQANNTQRQTTGHYSSSDEEEEETPEPDTTLFIKNLNVESDENAIKEHFKNCGLIHNVMVARKRNNVNKPMSMGFGFIQFKKRMSLEKALKSYQHSVLDGRSLELKRSNRTLQSDIVSTRKSTNIGKQSGSKIVVRNIPFQATVKEVGELFKTFGEIKSLRLPPKMDGSHRGFAFVEYYTKHDAKRAFKALCQSTHLYGRRLVLEWALNDENIDDLRKRTARYFTDRSSDYCVSKPKAEFEVEISKDE